MELTAQALVDQRRQHSAHVGIGKGSPIELRGERCNVGLERARRGADASTPRLRPRSRIVAPV
jgi:hypothetical protein